MTRRKKKAERGGECGQRNGPFESGEVVAEFVGKKINDAIQNEKEEE